MENEELNETLHRLYIAAEAASSEGLVDEAIDKCEQAMELLDLHYDEALNYVHSDFMMLAGHSCWEDSDARKAHHYYRQAYEMDFGRLDAAVAMAVSLFHLGMFAAAQNHLEMVSADETDVGEVWYYLALLADRRGDRDLAAIFFQRANEIEPNRWGKPHYHTEKELEILVEQFFLQLPEEHRSQARNLSLVFLNAPSDAQIHSFDPPLDPLSLVLFEGTTLMEEQTFNIEERTSKLLIFKNNVALIAGDPEKFRSEFEEALMEEYSRYLGLPLDDDEESPDEENEDEPTELTEAEEELYEVSDADDDVLMDLEEDDEDDEEEDDEDDEGESWKRGLR